MCTLDKRRHSSKFAKHNGQNFGNNLDLTSICVTLSALHQEEQIYQCEFLAVQVKHTEQKSCASTLFCDLRYGDLRQRGLQGDM